MQPASSYKSAARYLVCLCSGILASLASMTGQAAGNESLDFSFTQEPPGKLVDLDAFRLHVDCQGTGDVTILFEAGLGGSAFEWQPIQLAMSSRARACVYDRAGYGWSDPSPFTRTAAQLAREADQLLSVLSVDGPLVLVGHSFGGFIVRLLAERRREQMRGMVLVDTSHEDQLNRFEKLMGKNMMPRGKSFVVSPAAVSEALPEDIQRKIMAFSRMRKTYAALHSEMTSFRVSTEQVRRSRHVVDYPVIVISRGKDLYTQQHGGDRKTAIWEELQADLATLSPGGQLIIADESGHHVHADQPGLVTEAIISLIEN